MVKPGGSIVALRHTVSSVIVTGSQILLAVMTVVPFLLSRLIGFSVLQLPEALAVGTGITAKLACSGRYISGFTDQQNLEDIITYSPAVGLVTLRHTTPDTIETDIAGFAKAAARYYPGLGCTLQYPEMLDLGSLKAPVLPRGQGPWPEGEERGSVTPGLQQLLDAIREAVVNLQVPDNYQPFKAARGTMPWPIGGKRANSFGRPRNEGKMRWQGVTIPASEGDSVKAIHHGRVVYADWLRGSGLLMIIDHGEGYMSLYAHNQSLLREVGEWVSAGTPIITVGNSGGQEQSALYFEIRHQGKPTNPTKWCKD